MVFVDLELFRVAFRNIRGRQLRSFLTILGIVIGIAAIVALISVGEGLNQSVSQQFESLGTDTIIVAPGGGMLESVFAKLSDKDVETVESVKGVDFAAAIYMATEQVEFRGEKQTATIIGVDPDRIENLDFVGIATVEEGRMLTEVDSSCVVLGSKFASRVMKKEIELRQTLEIGGKKVRVAGVLAEAKNQFGSFFNNAVIMNSNLLSEISGEELTPLRIVVKAVEGEDIQDLKERLTNRLEREHNKKDFQVMDLQQISEIATSVVGMISLVLIGIAAISLLVGGIGIMNTMLMSVMERTQEVGVMKAIGATTWKILSIFVVEAGIIGLVGGIIGLLLGIGAAGLISIIAELAGLPLTTVVSPSLIIGALAFSMAVGMIAGVYPAKRAASIDPVESLRYE